MAQVCHWKFSIVYIRLNDVALSIFTYESVRLDRKMQLILQAEHGIRDVVDS